MKPRKSQDAPFPLPWFRGGGLGVLAAGKMLSFIFPTLKGLFFPKLRVHIKDNNKSPHGKFYSFLFPFSSKFSDLNFAPYVLRSHVLTRRVRVWVTYDGTWDRESTKMAPEKRACSKPELYSEFTVCTELQHSGLDSLPSGGLFVVV